MVQTTMSRALHKAHHRALALGVRLQRLLGGEGPTLAVLGTLTGVVAGFSAVAFVRCVEFLGTLVWTNRPGLSDVTPERVLEGAEPLAPGWYPLLVVPLGMLLVGLLVRRFAPDAAGHGVPEVMESVALKSGLMRGRIGVVKLIASSLNISFGGSVGKEGPIVQVGACFGSTVSRLFAIRGRNMRTLAGCGAAAGIAAVFNAPIGGAMFALEIIIGAYNLSSFSPVLMASVAGAVTSRRLLGAEPAFAIPEGLKDGLTITSPYEMGAYVVLGLVFGLLSVGFTRGTHAIEDGLHKLRLPWWARSLLAGLAVGALGMLLPRLLGEGHHTVTEVLVDEPSHWPWALLLALAVLKTVATAITLGGGGSGGVFAPSLFVGALLGAVFGQLMQALFPGQVGGMGAYALAGMGALLAGTAHAPMTGILLLFEMSDNYLIILPLMTATVVATIVAQRLMPVSIYTLPLTRRGIVLRDHQDASLLRRLRVADAMAPPTEALPDSTTFDRVVRLLLRSERQDIPVVDPQGHLTGVVRLDDLKEFLRMEGLDHLLLARECARPAVTLSPRATLLEAMELFDQHGLHDVPVVDDDRLVGSLHRGHVLRAYRRSLMAALPQG